MNYCWVKSHLCVGHNYDVTLQVRGLSHLQVVVVVGHLTWEILTLELQLWWEVWEGFFTWDVGWSPVMVNTAYMSILTALSALDCWAKIKRTYGFKSTASLHVSQRGYI